MHYVFVDPLSGFSWRLRKEEAILAAIDILSCQRKPLVWGLADV
jgi:hypothetical protein